MLVNLLHLLVLQVVVGGQRLVVSSSETQSSVEISQACAADTGSYTIVVRNREGSGNHTVALSVIGEAVRVLSEITQQRIKTCSVRDLVFSSDQPEAPASQPVISQLTSDSLVLSWTGPSYDGGKAVQGYIVEVQEQGPQEAASWTEIASRCKNTSYHVRSGLEPLGRYRFRVRAYNSAGVSEPSQESECVKMETASKPF